VIRHLSSSVTVLCLMLASAQAAEPPLRTSGTSEMPAAVTWTGLYAGIHGAFVSGETGLSELTRLNFPASWNVDGGALGVQVGYNYQINDVVLGLEAEYAFTGIEGSGQGSVLYFPGTLFESLIQGRLHIGLHQMMMLRPRIGVAADRSFVYVTAGAVAADMEARLDTVVISRLFGIQSDTTTTRNFVFGWTIGAGWEHAFSDKLSVKAEYLIVALDRDEFGNALEEDLYQGHFFRVGLNYHF
jgi:outer membrane immunogenic protein